MKPSKRVQQVLEFSFDNNLELVSYGLAPNPNGFCFEAHEGLIDEITHKREPAASVEIQREFHSLLETLNRAEVKEIRVIMFGGVK